MTARIEIDLAAFVANLRTIRHTVAPAEHLLVVKDDAYGHGLAPIVQAAADAGIGWFGTFDVATAVDVRRLTGPGPRIIAWTVYDDADVQAALGADIELGLGTRELVRQAAAGGRAAGRPVRVHLKADTGLHRNGIRPEDWSDAVATARDAEAGGLLRVEGVWSHIAEASDAEDDASRAAFAHAASAFGGRPLLRHLAASAAAFARAEFRFDLVRIGAFAYGIRPAGGPDDAYLGIRPIATLIAPVIAVDRQSVTLGIGYLDGLDSRLADRLDVATPAGSRRLREIGPTSSTVDGWDAASVGDDVALFGGRAPNSATDIAELLDTIGEEVVLRVSPRLPRHYRSVD
nr:alanine racemase [Microbacterium bovistercoris]